MTEIEEPAELYVIGAGFVNETELLEQSSARAEMMTKSLSKVIMGKPVGFMSQL